MNVSSKVLAAAVIAACAPWSVAPADAAPLAEALALKAAAPPTVEPVQYRRYRNRGWVGPAAGFAAGMAIGGALAAPNYYGDGYYAYGYAPAPGASNYGDVPPYLGYGDRGYGVCTGDTEVDSAYPNWVCQNR